MEIALDKSIRKYIKSKIN